MRPRCRGVPRRSPPRRAHSRDEFTDLGCQYGAQFALRTAPALERELEDAGHLRWKVVPFLPFPVFGAGLRRRLRERTTARRSGLPSGSRPDFARTGR